MSDTDPITATVKLIASLGRRDTYGVRTPPGYTRVDAPLTDDVVDRHLNGGPHVAVYPIEAGSDRTRLLVFDLDDHDGTVGWSSVRDAALAVKAEARRLYDLPLLLVRSGGGRGIHLIARWESGVSARDLRAAATRVVTDAGFRVGAGGIETGEIEVFPKQDVIGDDGYGNPIALPFGRESVPLDYDMEPATTPLPWAASSPPPPAPPEMPRRSAGPGPIVPIEDVRAALSVIPNDATTDYDAYISVGMEAHASTGGSDDGLAAWDEWAAKRAGKYDTRDVRDRWRSFEPTRTGFGALVKKARAAVPGWTPPSNRAPYLSEQWLALTFVAEHRDDLRYTAVWSRWHIWNGTRWVEDVTLRAFSLAQELCRQMAAGVNNAVAQRSLNKAATRAAVVSLARENPALATVPDQWDADPWLLGTPSGAVDLRTGAMLPPDPGRYLTRATAAPPVGECPLWSEKVLEICCGNADMVAFLRRWFGYCLTGLTREEMLLFFLGEGGNGKGTVIETIASVMGDYAVTVPMTTLVRTRHPEHPTEIAKLLKVRLAVASETEDGGRINAARVKLLTGGDRLTARFMRADYFDFDPTHKLVISGNRPLILGRTDKAIERRWLTVPFTRRFEPDKTVKERLRAEAGGILAWLIEGSLEWQRIGLAVPNAVRKATDEYLSSQDDLSQFIGDECIVEEPDLAGEKTKTLARLLYEQWRIWCARSGVYPGSFADFRERMKGRFRFTNTDNRPAFHGVKLSAEVAYRDAMEENG